MKKFYKTNQYIKADKVRLVDSAGNQLGIFPLSQALAKAQKENKDLVEVAANAKPPVVKIIQFSKFKYQEAKKNHQGAKSKQKTKQIRLTPFMAGNDLDIRVKKATKFLASGNRVKLVVKFKGRQIQKKEFGRELINKTLKKLEPISNLVEPPKMLGKTLVAQIKPAHKQNETKTKNS